MSGQRNDSVAQRMLSAAGPSATATRGMDTSEMTTTLTPEFDDKRQTWFAITDDLVRHDFDCEDLAVTFVRQQENDHR